MTEVEENIRHLHMGSATASNKAATHVLDGRDPNPAALAQHGAGHGSVGALLRRRHAIDRRLRDALHEEGVSVGTTDRAGLPADAKEAAAFALLGWLTWHGLPGNVPTATGAKRPAILGKVTLA